MGVNMFMLLSLYNSLYKEEGILTIVVCTTCCLLQALRAKCAVTGVCKQYYILALLAERSAFELTMLRFPLFEQTVKVLEPMFLSAHPLFLPP